MEEFGTLWLGGLGTIIILGLLVVAVLAFLIPFFILKIRNEVISINGKMGIIIELLRDESVESVEAIPSNIKLCTHCGARNRMMDSLCVNCGKSV